MEYTYDIYKKAWYNLETFQYEDDFDASTNKKRLKCTSMYGKFGSKYVYRDLDDIKLVFNNGDLFGNLKTERAESWFNIPKENIKNPGILKGHSDDFSLLPKYIKLCRDSCAGRNTSYRNEDPDVKKAIVESDSRVRKKLTTDQKLYIELNKSLLEGVENFSTSEGGDNIA